MADKKTGGPGRSFRKGISLIEAVQTFGDKAQAETWFIERRWPCGIRCVRCDGSNVTERANNQQRFWCKDCRRSFSVKTGTLMEGSNLTYSQWAIAFFLYSTNLKGVSSMKLHRDLGITQKAAWHMAHRIRQSWNNEADKFAGPVEVDETYIGGKERNKHANKKLKAGRGAVGKTAVVGMKDRQTGQITSQVVESTDARTLQNFVRQHTEPTTQVYTDEARAYVGIPRPHEAVKHSVSEFVRGMAHTNGMESHWASLKRGYDGVYPHMSAKHLHRYIDEFAGRHNSRPLDTSEQMGKMAAGMVGKRLTYDALIGPKHTRMAGGL